MSTIKKFVIICLQCKEESMCNIEWRPQQAFVFVCSQCGDAELVKATGFTPLNPEEFIEQHDGSVVEFGKKEKLKN